jgi:hypothetical protein
MVTMATECNPSMCTWPEYTAASHCTSPRANTDITRSVFSRIISIHVSSCGMRNGAELTVIYRMLYFQNISARPLYRGRQPRNGSFPASFAIPSFFLTLGVIVRERK